MEQEASLNFEDRHIPTQGSVPFTHSINVDNFVSGTGSDEAQPDEGINDTKFERSPSGGDNKSAYSTMVGFLFSHSCVKRLFCDLLTNFSFHCSALQVGSLSNSTIGIQRSSHGDYVIKYAQEFYITV